MAKILVTHPRLGFGGSEATVLWTVQALCGQHDVTLLTTEAEDLDQLNDFAGTDLADSDFELRRTPHPIPLDRVDRFAELKGRLFARACRREAKEHDLTISGYNVTRVNSPAIQMIADFSFLSHIRQQVTVQRSGLEQAWTGRRGLGALYRGLLDVLLPRPGLDWTQNTVVANSRWTRAILQDHLDVEAEVIYPPVPPAPTTEGVEDRELGFVALGRVVQEKRTHLAVEILQSVRDAGYPVELTILGPEGEPDYGAELRATVDARGDWVEWRGRVSEQEKRRQLAKNPYAIATRSHEPFGIAVAEVLQAGCIPFVPDEGGQTEIVDDDRLMYDSPTEAVDRIEAVITDEDLRSTLEHALDERRGRFSADRYQREIAATADRTLKEASSP